MTDPKDKIIKGLTERVNDLEAQLHDAVLAEREACAKLVEDFEPESFYLGQLKNAAKTIRARSKHD